MANKERKTNKEILREARQEGLFSEAEKFSKRKKKYRFKSVSDGVVSIAVIIIALAIIAWVRSW